VPIFGSFGLVRQIGSVDGIFLRAGSGQSSGNGCERSGSSGRNGPARIALDGRYLIVRHGTPILRAIIESGSQRPRLTGLSGIWPSAISTASASAVSKFRS
jgi:hypothetical protein